MNEEQKAYINELLKKDTKNSDHGKYDYLYTNEEITRLIYKGERVSVDYLIIELIKPSKRNREKVKDILKEIANNGNYDKYNKWVSSRGVKTRLNNEKEYPIKLVQVVKELAKQDAGKTFVESSNRVEDKKDNEIDQKIDGTDDEKTNKNEVNSDKLEQYKNPINVINEIVDDVNKKEQDKQDDEKSISKITTQPEEEQESFNLDELDLDYDFDKQDEKSTSQITTQPEEESKEKSKEKHEKSNPTELTPKMFH